MTHTGITKYRKVIRLATAVAVCAGASLFVAPPASATSYAVLNGSGSSWAGPAIDQWSQDVRDRGIVVNYSAIGSQQGRSNFTGNIVDFAGSDIAFLNGEDRIAGGVVEHSQYAYSYLPITAGGTAFMYHLTVAGQKITNLRLSGATIAKIFTGAITNWSDKDITKDYGAKLPDEPITPVIRSDGSGATAQFTAWMNDQYPDLWNSFCSRYAGISAKPCGETEFFPSFPNAKAQSSSTAAANYVTASSGEGSINYDEYSYALQSGYPVVKLLNPAGYYVLPTAQNDAVALTAAKINLDRNSINYLTQDLRGVYRNNDPRSYPLSSYSYMIVPRDEPARGARPPNFTDSKGVTLSTWANYFLCGGQKEMAALGYSPLPINLVKGGLDQVDKIFGAVDTPNRASLSGCNNPTFQNGKNTLLATAPYPTKCDKVGSALYGCTTAVSGQQNDGNGNNTNGGGNNPGTNNGGSNDGGSNNNNNGNNPGSGDPTGNSPGAGNPSGGQQIDPITGRPISDTTTDGATADGSTDGGSNGAAYIPPQAVDVSPRANQRLLWSGLAAGGILAAVLVPPFFGLYLRRRKGAA